jgi:hypothetical protein
MHGIQPAFYSDTSYLPLIRNPGSPEPDLLNHAFSVLLSGGNLTLIFSYLSHTLPSENMQMD